MRMLLEESRVLARGLAYHRRAALEAAIGRALDEADRQVEDLRREGLGRAGGRNVPASVLNPDRE